MMFQKLQILSEKMMRLYMVTPVILELLINPQLRMTRRNQGLNSE